MKTQVNKKNLILETDCPYKNKNDWKEIPPTKVDLFKNEYGCEVQKCDDGQNYVKCGSCTKNSQYPEGCTNSGSSGTGNSGSSGTGNSGSSGTGNSGSSGTSLIPTREDLKDAWEKFKEEAKKLQNLTPEFVLNYGGNIVSHIYNMGKRGLKQVTGDLMSVINSIPSPGTTEAKNVETLGLQEVMSDGIELTQGNVGKNVTELHKLLKKMGQTIDKTEYDGKLFGASTEKSLKNLQSQFEEPETGTLTSDFYNVLLQNKIEEPIQKVKGQKDYFYESVLINEAEELNIQKEFLTESKNLGCFDSYITKYELNPEPELYPLNLDGSEIYIFAYKTIKNPNVEMCFGADNWIYQIITDEKNNETQKKLNYHWFCGNKYCNTPPRQNYVKELIKSSPGTYELQKRSDQSEKIDLNDETKKSANNQSIGNKILFPKSNMCFIFRKSFEKATEVSVIGQVEKLLNDAGFTMNEPGISSYQKISFPVKNILGTSLTSQQKTMFKNQLERKAYPKSDSKQVNFIPKDTRLFGESCKSIYTKLSNAIEDPYSNFFSDKGETGKYTTLMQYKIMAMKCEESPKYMDFCRKNDDNRNICNNVRYSDSEYGIRDLIQNKTSTNENFISKTIKEHLIKLSKQKKKSLLEKRIVENRFKVLVENKNPRRIKDVNKFVQEAYDEMTYLSNQKYETNLISESLFDMMKLFVGPTGEQSVKKTFKQYVTNNLIQKLTPNKPNGYLAKIIEKTISELDLRDAPKLTDCYFVSEILTQSILNQIMIQKQKAEHHIENPLDELVKDSIFDSLYESNIHERLSSGISNYICPRLNQIQSNLDNKFIQSKNRIF